MIGRRVLLACAVSIAAACKSGTPLQGLAPAQETGGPRVRWDLYQTPLPEIPFPNDVATRPDPTSPTGLRVNASLIAPSQLERNVRALLDGLDGFGTYAPVTVAFDQDLDFTDLYQRQNDGDATNDGVYLIDLQTGELQPLDFNSGRYPVQEQDGNQYFRNDPLVNVTNVIFPTSGPTANFLHPTDPAWPASHGGVDQQDDDLLTFYERATRTLILRPVQPLKQERRYAAVLTTHLRGTNQRPVVSPFPSINHALQTEELRPLLKHLPPGLALSEIAFAWAFTTESTTRDLETIREGLYGRGPLKTLGASYPVTETRSDGSVRALVELLKSVDVATGDNTTNVFTVTGQQLTGLANDPTLGPLLFGSDPVALAALVESMKYVDYYVTGQYTTPDFLADPDESHAPTDAAFQLDLAKGTARTAPAPVYFFASVPKQINGFKAPFPVAIYGHGYTSARFEGILLGGGSAAKLGLSMVALDAYGHGLGVDAATAAFIRGILQRHHLGAFADVILKGRARDLDNDGIPDPGGDFWTADTFHTRDVVRQSIVDWFQLVRMLRTFDGANTMDVNGERWIAGDFNHDGVPDFGGPAVFPAGIKLKDGTIAYHAGEKNSGADLFAIGASLGGILASILPAVEPGIVAAAPISGGSGLSDIATRSTLGQVVQAVFLEMLGPMLVNCNWSVSDQGCDGKDAVPSLVFQVQQLNHDAIVPVAPAALHPGDLVTVCNLAELGATSGPQAGSSVLPKACKQAKADADGNLRLSFTADWPQLHVTRTPEGAGAPDKIDVQIVKPGDALSITISPADGSAARTLTTFEHDAQFIGAKYPHGSQLMAPARGYGVQRNTPELRRLVGLSQTILDPGDPVNYAPHYFNDLLPARAGVPCNILVIATVGDKLVPVATGISTGRAAGLVETRAIDPIYGMTDDQVLIRSGTVDAVNRIRRYAHADSGPRAALPGHIRCEAFTDRNGQVQPDRCGDTIQLDPTGFSCDENGANCLDDHGAPRLSPPLRQQLMRTTSTGVSALLLPYLDPDGRHAVHNPQPDAAFDMDQFMLNLILRYFQTRGREINFNRCQRDLASCAWIPPPPP